MADLPVTAVNNVKAFARNSGAASVTADTMQHAKDAFTASDLQALERAFAHEPAQIGSITNAVVAAPKVFPTSISRAAATATAAGALNDREADQRFDEFETHLPKNDKNLSVKTAEFADTLQAKTDFMNAPRNALFSLNPLNAMINLMQGKVQPDYATVAFGVGSVGTAAGLLKGGTNILSNITTKPMKAVGNFLSNQGGKLAEKENVLAAVGNGAMAVGNASIATATFLKQNVAEKLAGNGSTAGVLGQVQNKFGIVGKALGAPENFAYNSSMQDIGNIPSAAAAQVGVTFDALGMDKAAQKTIDVAQNLRKHEVTFGASAKEFLSKANNKISSVIGAVAGTGAADKAKDGLNAFGSGIANKNIMQAANQTAAVSSIAVQGVRDVSFMSRSIERLIEMYADMKGVDTKNVSPVKAMFDPNVSASVSKARNNLIKTVGLGAVTSAVSAMTSWHIASTVRGSQGMMLVLGLSMAQMPLRNIVFSQDPLLDNYSEVRDNFEKTGALELQSVAKLVTTASPTLRKTQSVDDVYALAQHYVDKQYTPGQLMMEIDNGGIAATMFEMKNEAFKEQAVAKAKAALPAEKAAEAASEATTPKTAMSEMQHEGRMAEKVQQQVAGA